MRSIHWAASCAVVALLAGGCRQQDKPSAEEQAAVENQAAQQAGSPAADASPLPDVDPAVVAAAEARAAEAEDRAANAEAAAKASRSEARQAAAELRAAEARAARNEARRKAEAARASAEAQAPAPVSEARPEPREARATPAPTPRPEPVVIPSGTPISLVLETPLSTKVNKLEDRVDASLQEDIRVDGRVIVPAGTAFRGYISQIQRSGKIGGRASLGVQFTTFRLKGREHGIDATSIGLQGKGAKKDAAVIGGGTGAGAVIGGIIGGKKGAVIGGVLGGAGGTVAAAKDRDDVEVPAGTVWNIELTAPVTID